MKGFKFLSLLLFELNYQLRTKAVYLFTLIYFGFACLMGSQGATPAGVNYNSEYELFFKMGLISLGAVFSIMFFVVTAVQRDSKYGMEALIFSSPLSKSTFFFSRFLGAWLVGILVIILAIPGFYLGVNISGLDPSKVAIFQIQDSIAVAGMLLIPSVSICTVLLFSACLITKNSLATYSVAVLIYALYFISAIFLNSPLLANAAPVSSENLFLAALADPFGLSAFFEQTNLWTPFQKNQERISFISLLGLNRLIWLGISGLILAACFRIFSFRSHNQKQQKTDLLKETEGVNRLSFPKPKKATISIRNYFPILTSLIRMDLKFIFQSIAFWAVLGTWIVLAVTEIYSKLYAGGAYDENYFPASQLLLEQVQQPLYLFGILLLVFFSGELVWRVKNVKSHEIISATPFPNTYFFLSKLGSLSILVMLLIGVTMVISLSFQLIQGYMNSDSFAIFSILLFPGIPLLFYASFFLIIQNFSRSNYLGMGLSVLAFALFAGPLGTAIGLNHPLWQMGDLPPLSYSQQAGWEMNSPGFWIFALLWSVLALSAILLLAKHWTGGLNRIKVTQVWNKPTFFGLGALLAFFALSGFCAYQINIIEGYQSSDQLLDRQEAYELTYKRFENAPVLSYSSIQLKVDLFPSKGTYHALVKGKLKNNSEEAIDKMLLTEKEFLENLWMEQASNLDKNELLKVYEIEFENPVLPEQEIEFSFEVKTNPTLFKYDPAIIQDGSYLNLRDFAPYFGYSEGREISNNQERKKRNLPLKPDRFSTQDHMEQLEVNLMKVDFEAEISTESGQTALTSGDLITKKTEGNREIFFYKSPEKIMPAIAIFSGNYQVESLLTDNLQLQVYTIPAHRFASKETLNTMKLSLEYLSKTFGDYPFSSLKIVEIPSFWGFGGFAHPGIISMVEDNYFLVKPQPENQFDLRRKRAIHEVAHQWFGHLLAPRNIPGASFFVEGLAKYSEALVLKETVGKPAIWNLTDNANRTYFSGRAFAKETEPPLSSMEGQNYLAYGKSILSLLAIEDLIGSERLNSVIRKMVDQSRNKSIPSIAFQDFLNELNLTCNASEMMLIRDWLEKVIHYDIKIESAQSSELDNGSFETRLTYSAKKLETLSDGSIREIEFNEPIRIALFEKHPDENILEKEIISSEIFSLESGKNELILHSKVKPKWIGIDPWGTRPDQDRRDNFLKIE
ncbi:ABC-type transport system involved in multi-copper enzyme maturation permease subunit [Algoriphagus iocasae]|uniref:ABC-type transport system involved in multi-copper enzyme maturation permease subunit n=1 Tax=Algoriphagus iocasae TaxID=1836499 RepID=A0A841MKH2_9BACT|nr:M1 family aminopeptidase [Algoriphagus iocasae]MBB6324746.1 ABC-type transport system involved in multi-copper enzyme maturation permease subunit [Algoriphagus iocasae]